MKNMVALSRIGPPAPAMGSRKRGPSPGKCCLKKTCRNDSESATEHSRGAAATGVFLAPGSPRTEVGNVGCDRLFRDRRTDRAHEPNLSPQERADACAVISNVEAANGTFAHSAEAFNTQNAPSAEPQLKRARLPG